jgi:hypothetical protein
LRRLPGALADGKRLVAEIQRYLHRFDEVAARADHAGLVALRTPANDPPPNPPPQGGRALGTSAPGATPPAFETKTLATTTADLPG